MARWKYTIRRLGLERVKAELRERFKLDLKDAAPVPIAPNQFWHGWHPEIGGKWFLGIPVESGRVQDTETCRMRAAITAVTRELPELGLRITGNQDLILTHVTDAQRARVDAILAEHGVKRAEALSLFRKQAFGCPALPTCGLAMTHAERAIPAFADAVEAAGDYEQEITGIVLGIVGDLEGVVLLLVTPEDAEKICELLGVEPGSEYAPSALGEVGNIVGSSYINALAEMTGIAIEPTPPATATDMLGAIVQSVLAGQAHAGDIALMLDSELAVEGSDCSISFMLVPTQDGVGELLERLGLG
jgi:chemotaxis protein CheC